MAKTDEHKCKGKGAQLKLILAASLVLNGFMAGYILGQKPNDHKKGPMMPPPAPEKHFMSAAEHLPKAHRDHIKGLLKDKLPRPDMKEGRAAFDDLRRVLMSADSSVEDLDKAIANMDAHHKKMGKGFGQALRAVYLALPNTQIRAAFFEKAFPSIPPHMGKPDRKDKKPFKGEGYKHAPAKMIHEDHKKHGEQCLDKDKNNKSKKPHGHKGLSLDGGEKSKKVKKQRQNKDSAPFETIEGEK